MIGLRWAGALGALVAIALLVVGCGGGGGAASTTSRSSAAAPATGGGFQAAIPSGWHSGMAAARNRGYRLEYAATGPSTGGVTADLIVTRVPARSLTDAAVPSVALAGLQREKPANQSISQPRQLTVDGAPAVAVDYMHLAAPQRLVFHETVDVLHGGWLYIVTGTAARSGAITGSLDAMLSSWRWS